VFFKNIIRVKLLLLVSLSVIVICSANIIGGYLLLPGNLDEDKTVIISPNLSVHNISQVLEAEKIITNSLLFEIVGKIYAYFEPLKSGEYKFTKYITPYQVLKILSKGKSVVHRILIPEGYTVSQIVDIVNYEDRLTGKINGSIPEGYLMPSTYFYTYLDQREKIIDEMRKEMSGALDQVMTKLSKDSPLKTRKDILILASIIEKEAGNNEERAKIAAVFINRLKKGMKLQSDPTTVYAITEGKEALGRSLSRNDLKIDSPYNTYNVKGLPPGAISCPGRASLEATVAPAEIDALYFVANCEGGHSFSKTLKEHNLHVKKFRTRIKQNSQD
jgi:UPF0755 protein